MADDKQVIEVGSFDDLVDHVEFVIEIERPGAVTLRVPVRELTYGEWIQVELDYPLPKPPVGGYLSGGQPWYDTNDTDYRKARLRASEMWTYRRLLKALRFDVPGETVEEQAGNLEQKLGAGALMTLARELDKLHGVKASEVRRLSESFQPVPVDGDTDL